MCKAVHMFHYLVQTMNNSILHPLTMVKLNCWALCSHIAQNFYSIILEILNKTPNGPYFVEQTYNYHLHFNRLILLLKLLNELWKAPMRKI